MAGNHSKAAWIAGAAVALFLLVPSKAAACEAHQKQADLQLQESVKADAKAEAKPKVVAERCKCDGPSDCTCQRGKCQCSKCSKPRRYKVVESLRDRGESRERPDRRNAAAGTFI